MDADKANPTSGCRWLTGLLVVAVGAAPVAAAEPVALRAESFTVQPSAQPLAFVAIKNLQAEPYEGAVTLKAPSGWRVVPPKRDVTLAPGQTKRVSFRVERGLNVAANAYAVEVSAVGGGVTVIRRQTVVCASAPYYKPTIDGDSGEWKDAIPAAFTTGGKKTVISTYWNRRQFSLLVAVEEDKLIGYRQDGVFDALQVAVSPQDAKTGKSPDDVAARYEFLFVWTGNGTTGRCYQLASPGMKLTEAAKCRELAPLTFEQAKVAVRRVGAITYYECAIPFRLMRKDIRPSEGREFGFSVCVHDPDGTGVRDWGAAAGLWPSQRNRLAWSGWRGAKWGNEPPFDNKLEWGMCSSKY